MFDEEGNTIEDTLGSGLTNKLEAHKVGTANRLFHEYRFRQGLRDGTIVRNKTAVFVINTKYTSQSGLKSLKGPLEDLKLAEILFKARGYTTHIIHNSKNVETDIIELIEANEEEFKELDVLQFVYSGKFQYHLHFCIKYIY